MIRIDGNVNISVSAEILQDSLTPDAYRVQYCEQGDNGLEYRFYRGLSLPENPDYCTYEVYMFDGDGKQTDWARTALPKDIGAAVARFFRMGSDYQQEEQEN